MDAHQHDVITLKEEQGEGGKRSDDRLEDRFVQLRDWRGVEVHGDSVEEHEQWQYVDISAQIINRLSQGLTLNLCDVFCAIVVVDCPVAQPHKVHFKANFISKLYHCF